MLAYLLAQFIDIRIYHFWKNLTKGKHLWLRNNFSTWLSQFIDTLSIITLLCYFEVLPWSSFKGLLISGFLFKVLVAALDTPFLYLGVYLFRKRFRLKVNEEISLNITTPNFLIPIKGVNEACRYGVYLHDWYVFQ